MASRSEQETRATNNNNFNSDPTTLLSGATAATAKPVNHSEKTAQTIVSNMNLIR